MCEWDGFFFPANSSTHKFCSGDCKNASRREHARAKRDAAAAHERWKTGELNNDELAAELIRVQYMPQCMNIPFQQELKAQEESRIINRIRFHAGIMKLLIQTHWNNWKERRASSSTTR